jgi:4-amino-4-deoxy-L-arabinose transferase-like glycosyltransferase
MLNGRKIAACAETSKGLKVSLWIMLAAFILLVVAIRIRLLEFPLERDEGEYAYAGQLMLQGIPPYQLAYNMKLPGVYAAYAFIMAIFGQTAAGIHLGLMVVNVITTVLVFFLAKRISDYFSATVAASAFILLSVSPALLGMAGHATHFILLPAVAGLLALLHALDRDERSTLFLSGLLFGLAFLMKQQGIFFGIFGGLYLIYSEVRTRPVSWSRLAARCAIYSAGAILPLGITCLLLYRAGVFSTFWFWTVSYARQYVAAASTQEALQDFIAGFTAAFNSGWVLWIFAGAGIVVLLSNWKPYRNNLFIIGLLLFSFLSICPGFYFRQHYFILLLPAVAVAIGLAISSSSRWIAKKNPRLFFIPVLLFILACAHSVYAHRNILFFLTPQQACRAAYGVSPFPEALKIAEYIKQRASKDATIAVLGSEPEIFFYSGLKSSTGYIYMYGPVESQSYAATMRQQMFREIESAKPEYVIVVNIPTSWLASPQSNRLIIDWLNRYAKEKLELVGLIDILSATKTVYHWDLQERSRSPQSPYFITVYKQKPVSETVKLPL